MIRVARALYPPLVRALLLVHAAALGLLTLVVAVERQAAHADFTLLFADVLPVWARLAPALTLLGGALAAYRMRRTLLTLGTLGLGEGALAVAALPLGVLVGTLALRVPARAAASSWSRGVGGWFHLGQAVPDVAGGVVTALPSPVAWSILAASLLAAPLGARRWATGPLAVVTVASVLAEAATPWGGAVWLGLGGIGVAVLGRAPQARSGPV